MKSQYAIVAAAIVSLVGSTADAGLKNIDSDYYVDVVASGSDPNANGSFGSALRSPDNVQYIGCGLTGTSVSCYAKNAAGAQLSCTSTAANIVAAVKSLDSASFLAFTTDSTKTTCVNLVVDTYSFESPK